MKRKILYPILIIILALLTLDAWNYPQKHPEILPSVQADGFNDIPEVTIPSFQRLTRHYEPENTAFSNPLMGYAVGAQEDVIDEETTLIYIDLTWREWEAEMDQYNVENIRKVNRIDQWKAEGRHAVLRFLCDLPSEVRHMDIPDWLYAASGNAGTFYQNSYGSGFSPDYSNAYIQERHAAAVKALGEAFGQDTFVSYVELGSLGHWGEWHVAYDDGIPRLPGEQIRDAYVTPWQEAFPNARIMMRRPFSIALTQDFGLFNDIIGDSAGTKEWLNWIQAGGNYDQTLDISDTLKPMPGFWKTAPSGGELTSGIPMETLMEERLGDVIQQLQNSHTTFIGPKTVPPEYTDASNTILSTIGYKFYISQADLAQEGNQLKLTTNWTNNGIAPIYWDWPVYIYVKDREGSLIEKVPMRIMLSTLLPGTKLTNNTLIDIPQDVDLSTCSYWIGIEDPMTLKPSILFDMKTEQENGLALLF